MLGKKTHSLTSSLLYSCVWFTAQKHPADLLTDSPKQSLWQILSLSVPHFDNLCFLYYSLNMTVDSFCLPNYYGDTCSTYCYPNTRYTCDRFGRKQCKHGILVDILHTQRCRLIIVWGLRLWRAEFYYDSRIQWC